MLKSNLKNQAKPGPGIKLDPSQNTHSGIPEKVSQLKGSKSTKVLRSNSKGTLNFENGPVPELLVDPKSLITSLVLQNHPRSGDKPPQALSSFATSRDVPSKINYRPNSSKTLRNDPTHKPTDNNLKESSHSKNPKLVIPKTSQESRNKLRPAQTSRESSETRHKTSDLHQTGQNKKPGKKKSALSTERSNSREKGQVDTSGKIFSQLEKYMSTKHVKTTGCNSPQLEASKIEKSKHHLRSQSTVDLKNVQSGDKTMISKPQEKTELSLQISTQLMQTRSNSPPIYLTTTPKQMPSSRNSKDRAAVKKSQNASPKTELLKNQPKHHESKLTSNDKTVPCTQLNLPSNTSNTISRLSHQSSVKSLHSHQMTPSSLSHGASSKKDPKKVLAAKLSTHHSKSTKDLTQIYHIESPDSKIMSNNDAKMDNCSVKFPRSIPKAGQNFKIDNKAIASLLTQQISTKSKNESSYGKPSQTTLYAHSICNSIASNSTATHKASRLCSSLAKSQSDKSAVSITEDSTTIHHVPTREAAYSDQHEIAQVIKDFQTYIYNAKESPQMRKLPAFSSESLKLSMRSEKSSGFPTGSVDYEENLKLKTELNSINEKIEKMQGSIARFQASFSKIMLAQEEANNKLYAVLSEELSGRATEQNTYSDLETIKDYNPECSDSDFSDSKRSKADLRC